ncbi:MAG: hypothetical protein IPJ68_00710 [Candidatus Moraniibacteriota bacterium]|nr:MAG: hypothetical protein IPJ68_00710 [Candidatus Moranbacteria bacterium]
MESNIAFSMISAFSGAFFAFLFLRLAEFFTKLYERQVRHYNSLVSLEMQLLEDGAVIQDNLFTIGRFVAAIKINNVTFEHLRYLSIDKSHYEMLYDLSLKNELYAYHYDLRRLNDDVENISKGYDEIRVALLQKNLTLEDYRSNVGSLAGSLDEQLRPFLIHLQDKIVTLLARVRLQIKYDKPLGNKIMTVFLKTRGPKLDKKEIDREKKIILAELEENAEASKIEKQEILRSR